MKATKKEIDKILKLIKKELPIIDTYKLTYRKDIDNIYYLISEELGVKVLIKNDYFNTFKIYAEPSSTEELLNDTKSNPYKVINYSIDEFISNYMKQNSMSNIIETLESFFKNHYNCLKGFPKLINNSDNFYVFEYVSGVNTFDNIIDDTKILSSHFDNCVFNYKYLKANNIPINYEYSLSDSILNETGLYFVDIENFEINAINYWYMLHTSNDDNQIDLRFLNKATNINSYMMLEAN